MARLHLDLGKPVVAADGTRVGTVDRLVLDATTRELEQIIIHQGRFLTRDRIVELPLIERIDPDGTVHLSVPAAAVDRLPEFIEANFIVPPDEDLASLPDDWADRAKTEASILYALGGAYGGLIEPTPMPAPVVETVSNLGEDAVIVDEGTHVVDRDGNEIGTVDEIVYDEDGNVAGFVVRAGFLFHHDVQVPAAWVESVTTDRVQLRVTAEEAEQAGTQG
ncbi:MAG: PRC-barrel domain-containing protein [Sphaerobacter sp.]|nr:PRC-barrel domain-containing protein [Sphaerobacter sp.]